jgi:hypothetical protein
MPAQSKAEGGSESQRGGGVRTDAQRHAQRTAQRLANEAKHAGKIKAPSRCERCRRRKPHEMHHRLYCEPLAVMWLCRLCHHITHREMKAAGVSAFDLPTPSSPAEAA